MLTGSVIGQCLPRHRHDEFLTFLNTIDHEVPKGLQVHLILDNYSTHKHADVDRWLKRHKRFHLHFTPTSSLPTAPSWFLPWRVRSFPTKFSGSHGSPTALSGSGDRTEAWFLLADSFENYLAANGGWPPRLPESSQDLEHLLMLQGADLEASRRREQELTAKLERLERDRNELLGTIESMSAIIATLSRVSSSPKA